MSHAGRQNRFWVLQMAVIGLAAMAAESTTIFRPQLGVPEFAEPGGTFRIEVKAGPDLASNQWQIILANDLRTWTNCALEGISYGAYVDNGSCTGY